MDHKISTKEVVTALFLVFAVMLWHSGGGYTLSDVGDSKVSEVRIKGAESPAPTSQQRYRPTPQRIPVETTTPAVETIAPQPEPELNPAASTFCGNHSDSTSVNASRVGILVTATYGPNETAELRWMLDPSYALKKAYARRHGYDLIWEMDSRLKYENRTGHWVKLTAAAKWLPHYQWLWVIDADTLITNMTRPLPLQCKYGLIVAMIGNTFNSGVMLLQRSEWAYNFLHAAFALPTSVYDCFEQGALNYLQRHFDYFGRLTDMSNTARMNQLPPYRWGRMRLRKRPWCVKGPRWRAGDLVMHFPLCIRKANDTFVELAEAALNQTQIDPWEMKLTAPNRSEYPLSVPGVSGTEALAALPAPTWTLPPWRKLDKPPRGVKLDPYRCQASWV